MKNKNKLMAVIVIALLVIALLVVGYFTLRSPWKYQGDGPIKILHLNSYHDGFPLVNDNVVAFERSLRDAGMEVEVRHFEMNMLINDSVENANIKTKEAVALIEEWAPDMIYATDDPAQEYVIEPNYRNSDIPIIFTGINNDIEIYDYENSDNIAGVFERLRFVDSVNLLKQLYPSAKKIVVVADDFPQWVSVLRRFESQEDNISLSVVDYKIYETFEEYKEGVLGYESVVDAIVFLGLNTLKDENGISVPRRDVIRWNIENLDLPDVTFWGFVVGEGTLMAVETISSEEGEIAAEIAKDILIEGKTPSDIPYVLTKKGQRYINLARAEMFGLDVRQMLFENAGVSQTDFEVYLEKNYEFIEGFSFGSVR